MHSSQDIVERLIRRRPAERMGLYELIWPDTLRNWTQQGYPKDAEGNPVPVGAHFGLDMDWGCGWWDVMPIKGYLQVEEQSDEWEVKRNGAGAALKFWKQKSGTPEHIDFRMTSRQIWERDYRSHLLTLDPGRLNIEESKKTFQYCRQRNVWTFFGHLFVFENLRQSIGDICLYESVLLDPDWIHDYNRVYTDFFKMHYKYLFEHVGIPDGVWMFEDLGYKQATFCSQKVYDELFFPYYKELIDFFHSYRLPVILHSCGFIEDLVPRFIELGYDALNPMENKAGCDPLRLAKKYGDKLTFIGGLDVSILESGDRNYIRDSIVKLTRGMKDAGASYIFATDHSVSTSVRYDDYKYALDIFRQNSYY